LTGNVGGHGWPPRPAALLHPPRSGGADNAALRGRRPANLADQLKAFRDQSRHDPSAQAYMWGIARSLSDDQIEALASYYASQPMRLADTP
jgi:cytochrome c553